MEFSDYLVWKVVIYGLGAFLFGLWRGLTGRRLR
jgi:hypothetical protein